MSPGRGRWLVGASRLLAVTAVLVLLGLLPWLSGRQAEYTVLRARYADREATPEALAAVRAELGLDAGPLPVLGRWLAGLARGDAGDSWISGAPVLPQVVAAVGISATLMGFALAVALPLAALLVLPGLVSGVRGRPGTGPGVLATTLTALPEFLLAVGLLLLGAVWLGWFPPFGWLGPWHAVLPALALGLPTGGLLGGLVAESVAATFEERWTTTWRLAGIGGARLARAVLRRALAPLVGQLGLVLIGLTGGAVVVEQVFAVPGLGRLTLEAASAQDLPVLQTGVLALLLLAVTVGVGVRLARRLLVGPAVRLGSLAVPGPDRVTRARDLLVPAVSGSLLLVVVVAGLLRDPYAIAHPRLAPPSAELPLGADALGRDLLARVGHGALGTVGVALAVVALCLLLGLLLGLAPQASTGPLEVTNAAPPVVAGLLVAAVQGPSVGGAALAVALVSWAPLAAHAGALVEEARARPHVRVLPVLGVSTPRVLLVHVLPVVVGPVTRHALLRLPGVALALAALGFLGLGPQPPLPEWGLLLAEGSGYAERAPWTVLAPAGALALVSVLAVSSSTLRLP